LDGGKNMHEIAYTKSENNTSPAAFKEFSAGWENERSERIEN
jgi:hypothetical protein